jgi:hypothetical protein
MCYPLPPPCKMTHRLYIDFNFSISKVEKILKALVTFILITQFKIKCYGNNKISTFPHAKMKPYLKPLLINLPFLDHIGVVTPRPPP